VAKLPTDLSGRQVRAALERAGFVFRRQTGSHMVLRREQPYARAIGISSIIGAEAALSLLRLRPSYRFPPSRRFLSFSVSSAAASNNLGVERSRTQSVAAASPRACRVAI
jgi:hypothetical protein